MGLIYMYTSPSNKRYIGQTVNLKKRHNQHIQSAINEKDPGYNYPFHKAIRKYGIENFDLQILEDNIDDVLIDEKEQYWIKKMNSFGKYGYNANAGGSGNHGRIWTDEQKENMSKIKSGTNIGHIVSKETRDKISSANKGKSHKHSDETKKKISEHNAKAVRKKIMIVNDGIYHNKEFYNGMIFDSVKECADYFGVKINTMSNIKNNKFNKKSNIKIIEINTAS